MFLKAVQVYWGTFSGIFTFLPFIIFVRFYYISSSFAATAIVFFPKVQVDQLEYRPVLYVYG